MLCICVFSGFITWVEFYVLHPLVFEIFIFFKNLFSSLKFSKLPSLPSDFWKIALKLIKKSSQCPPSLDFSYEGLWFHTHLHTWSILIHHHHHHHVHIHIHILLFSWWFMPFLGLLLSQALLPWSIIHMQKPFPWGWGWITDGDDELWSDADIQLQRWRTCLWLMLCRGSKRRRDVRMIKSVYNHHPIISSIRITTRNDAEVTITTWKLINYEGP